jgi:UDP-glucose 4-epimerase
MAVENFLKNGFEVIAIDNLSNFSTKKINPKATFIEADMSDEKAIKIFYSITKYMRFFTLLPQLKLENQ